MSPVSRGRPPGRGRDKRRQRSPRELRVSDHLLADASEVDRELAVLDVETWASGWLGVVWATAGISERDPEAMLCTEVAGRVSTKPSSPGLAALAALRRVAPLSAHRVLDEAVQLVSADRDLPPWATAPGWEPVAAWRAVDVWDSERVLFVEYDGPERHTLMAAVTEVGGALVDTLALLQPDAASGWAELREPDDVPMPVVAHPVAEVLAELASALDATDRYWPKHEDDDFVDLRALAWSRSRGFLGETPDWHPLSDEARDELVDAFVSTSGLPDDDVTRSLADLFLDYGDGYLTRGPLCWSPGWVYVFLGDWLPRKVVLDTEQRAALPEALRRWVRFALGRRGVDTRWIDPVVDAVDASLPEFHRAFDSTRSGPADELVEVLLDRGVDLTDPVAVQDAVRALNAERLARQVRDVRGD